MVDIVYKKTPPIHPAPQEATGVNPWRNGLDATAVKPWSGVHQLLVFRDLVVSIQSRYPDSTS